MASSSSTMTKKNNLTSSIMRVSIILVMLAVILQTVDGIAAPLKPDGNQLVKGPVGTTTRVTKKMHTNFKMLCIKSPDWCKKRMMMRQKWSVSDQMRSRRHLSNRSWQRMVTMRKVKNFVKRNMRVISRIQRYESSGKHFK